MYSSSKKAFDSFAGVRVGTGLGDCAANRRPTATRRRVPWVDVDAPSENRAALAARGCDEPGLAAVAGAVVAGADAVTGAGAAGAGAAAVKGAAAVTGVVAGAAAPAGTAADTGEGCVVAMFAPRPLL